MSDILFGQSYYLRFDPKLWQAMQPYPPLGTLYAAAYLRQRGYTVALFDAMLAQSEQEWEQALDLHRPRFAVLFEDNFNYLSKMCLLRMRHAAGRMIELAQAKGAIVIISGSDATDHLEEYFAHGANYILLGEGEVTLGELIDHLNGQRTDDLASIRGLAFPGPDGRPAKTHPREFLRELDNLPFPAWDLIDVPRYRRIWQQHHGYYSMNMVTTRGCPYSCNWCAKPIYGQRYNVRSPENVVAELVWLRRSFAPDHIEFADDIFGLKPHWIERYAALVHEHDCVTPFKCLLRADLVKASTAESLALSGCQTVWMGAESGSQKILDAMDKGTRVEQIRSAAHLLRAAGIRVGFFLQFGYRGETRQDIEKTLQLVRDANPDEIGVSVSYPLPGTRFYEQVKQDLGAKQNWTDSDDLAMIYEGPYSTEFYRTLHRAIHAEFRMRKARAELERVWSSPARWRRNHLRQLASIPVHALRLASSRSRMNRLEQQSSIQVTNPAVPALR